jgi:hypothetical protein
MIPSATEDGYLKWLITTGIGGEASSFSSCLSSNNKDYYGKMYLPTTRVDP